MIGENRAPLKDGFHGYGAFLAAQAEPDKVLGQLSIGLFAHKLLAGLPPEIDATHVKSFAHPAAEELDQGTRVGPFSGFGRDKEEEILKCFIGPAHKRIVPLESRVRGAEILPATAC